MKKTIAIKSKKMLVENSLKIGDIDYEKKLRKRIVDLSRARDLAQTALNTAEENEQVDLAAKLKTKIDELNDLLATYNADSIDNDADNEVDGDANAEDERDTDSENEGDEEEEVDGGRESNKKDKDSEKDLEDEDGSEDDSDAGEDGEDSEEDSDSEFNDGQDGDDEAENDQEDQNQSGREQDEGQEEEGQKSDDEQDPSEDEDNEEEDNKSSRGDGDPAPEEPKETTDSQKNSKSNSSNSNDSQEQERDNSEESDGTQDDAAEQEDSEDDNSNSDSQSKDKSNDADSDSSNDEDDSEETESEESESQDDDSDGESAQSETKPSLDQDDDNDSNSNSNPEFENPFADNEDIPSGLSTGGNGDQPREATTDETIELLKTLKGEGRKGAIDALKDLIAKRESGNANESFRSTSKKSLTEAIKGVRDMTDDEFGDYINGVYDLIDQVTPVNYVDDIEDRKQKIGKWSQDPTVAQEIQAEDNLELQKDYQQKKARDAAKARYSSMGSLQDFQMDFYAAINNQIETIRQEYQSYDEINVEYESEDAIMKADLEKELPAEAIPIVDVYFDVSGSWDDDDIKLGEAAVASVKVFEDQGELVMNIFYFSNGVDNVSLEHCRQIYGTGTIAWPDILQNIKATKAKNVLIMTDNDFEILNDPGHFGGRYGPIKNGSVAVEGCVWYLWKNGQSSPSCIKKLNGRQGTYQYSFNA